MKRKIERFIKKNETCFERFDFYDFTEMLKAGLQDEEIAEELGISKKGVQEFKNKIYKEFDARW
jgi:DNA-directed RNA polymerase specialized sigma subunit